jgi:hypothetical protein
MSYTLVLPIINSNIFLQEDPDSMTGGKVGVASFVHVNLLETGKYGTSSIY